MLANLDNEVIFKKAFTDTIVFKAFVKDILGIDIEVGKIETENKFSSFQFFMQSVILCA
jgi:hypothetical protein